MGCNNDHINVVPDRDTRFEHMFEGLATAQSMDELKGYLLHLFPISLRGESW